MSAHEVSLHDAALMQVGVFLESDDNHSVPAGTLPPAAWAVVTFDLAGVGELVVAGGADIVVTCIVWVLSSR